MKILLTGATGFIGKALVVKLLQQNFNVSVVVRGKTSIFSDKVKQYIVDDFRNNSDLSLALEGIDCVVHLAAKAHVIDKSKASVLDEFRKINTEFTLNLARQAMASKVKRLIFLSSVGVNGNQNTRAFLETDIVNPQEPYAISKCEAEQGLLSLAQKSDLEVVIIRPPLVYENDAPGNFGQLLKWIDAKHPLPLPLGSVHNQRSFVALDNLVDFITTTISHKNAANEIFLISDGEDLSTTELMQKLSQAFNKKIILLPIPTTWMIFMAKLIGKEDVAIRLFSSLQVDSSKARKLLDWKPVVSMDFTLRRIASEKRV